MNDSIIFLNPKRRENMETQKEIILNALGSYKGDDFERAAHKMRGKDPDADFFNTGQTYKEILNEYDISRKKINKAIEFVKNLL